jgi:hypothetical protein
MFFSERSKRNGNRAGREERLPVYVKGFVVMGTRRDKMNRRRENQLKTRAANSSRKQKERARKTAYATAQAEAAPE